MRFAVQTFGCKVNQYESSIVSASMIALGFQKTDIIEFADIIIVNSCTVTGKSNEKAVREIQNLRKNYPRKVIALTGCFPQAYPDIANKLPADIIIGSEGKEKLPALIFQFIKEGKPALKVLPISKDYEEFSLYPKSENTRAYLKIEDGCDRFCSYCIIPTARGRVRSRKISEIEKEARFISEGGTKEIVLTGINLSSYGKDLGLSLFDAVNRVASLPNVGRVRLSSLEPDLITSSLIGQLADVDKLCPHFHLSLQSGSTDTLKRMNRCYSANEYECVVQKIREAFKNPAITTDVMVGFPGENEGEFLESLQFVEKIGFAKIHVFPYSIREGTPAATLENQVAEAIKRERHHLMCEIGEKCKTVFLKTQIGKTVNIITEKQTTPDFIFGHSENYTPVRIYNYSGINPKRGDILSVRIINSDKNFCYGEP